jgi:inorganic pyrophosphatase
MYSITKEGKVIFIDRDKYTKLEFYKQNYGLFETSEEAEIERDKRKKATKETFGE